MATCMYYTGIDPFTKQAVYIAKGLRDRRMQREKHIRNGDGPGPRP